ncbi:MAG: hypothetical protein JXA78_04070 [Anaerolineales bacterium]|nr:hypothetical protein [Anaerolineales bacterium]
MNDQDKIERFNLELDSMLLSGKLSNRGLPAEDWRALELAHQLAGMDPGAQSQARIRLRMRLVEQSRQLQQPATIRSALAKLRLAPSLVAVVVLAALVGWIFNSLAQLATPSETSTVTMYATDTALLASAAPTQQAFSIEAVPLASGHEQPATAHILYASDLQEYEQPSPSAIPIPTAYGVMVASAAAPTSQRPGYAGLTPTVTPIMTP